jgi:hypothetical protein
MLEQAELERVAAEFGVSEAQVRRDHMISHILMALAELDLPITFFGGTALARTYLADPGQGARLSEDIDLYTPDRREVASVLDERLPRLMRREFPGTVWDPALSGVRSVEPGQLLSREGLRVRVQLLNAEGEWPADKTDVELRYGDTPGTVRLLVPTLAAFAAMKTMAWADRHTARDLYDLAGLARLGALNAEARDLFKERMGWTLSPHVFESLPEMDWEGQLSHQTRLQMSARDCLEVVKTKIID